MSDKKTDNDNNNTDTTKVEIDEKKDDVSREFLNFEKSGHFHDAAASIYNITNNIFKKNRISFYDKNFHIYSPFFEKFQPGKDFKPKSVSGQMMKKNVLAVYNRRKCPVYRTFLDESNPNFENQNAIINGLLFLDLQNYVSSYESSQIASEEKLESVKAEIFPVSNVFCAISTKRTVDEYFELASMSRIAIHLKQSPADFWKSSLFSTFLDTLLPFDFVVGAKVRAVREFGRGDSLLIYCSVPAVEAWQKLGPKIARILPSSIREEYPMPFAAPLDEGINGNIPINCISSNEVNKTSFTNGIAILAKLAFLRMGSEGLPEPAGLFSSKKKKQITRQKNIANFEKHLANVFRENALFIDKRGALHQPKPPLIK